MESSNVQNDNRNSNSILSDRLYGEHYPDSFIDLPGPVRTTRYGRMDNNDRYVRQEHKQSNKPNIASGTVNHQPDCDGTDYASATDCTPTHHTTVCVSHGDSSRGTQTRDIEYELTTSKPNDKQLNDFNESANFEPSSEAKAKHRWFEPCVIAGPSE
jgi:hypothetical protein